MTSHLILLQGGCGQYQTVLFIQSNEISNRPLIRVEKPDTVARGLLIPELGRYSMELILAAEFSPQVSAVGSCGSNGSAR